MKSDNWYKLKVLVTPEIWIRSERTSAVVTRALQHQLNLGYLPERIDYYNVKLGALVLWGANYPYGFGSLKEVNGIVCESAGMQTLPARWMVLKLGDLLDMDSFEEQYIESYLANKNGLASAKLRSSKPVDNREGS